MQDDLELLWEYARSGSNQAFATVATRYVDLIYSAALRQVRDPHVAEDVTQAVLILLMHKAGSLEQGTVVPGWLLRATRFAAMDAMKMDRRRRKYETRAGKERRMSHNEAAGSEVTWEEVSPLVDSALLKLKVEDRDAVVMRYLLGRSPEEIAWVMGVDEPTARKRVSRALGRLRNVLSGMGVRAEEEALGTVLSASAVMRAPASVTAAAAKIGVLGSGALSAPPAVIASGASRAMNWAARKWVVYGTTAATVAMGVGVWLAITMGRGHRDMASGTGAPGTTLMTTTAPTTQATGGATTTYAVAQAPDALPEPVVPPAPATRRVEPARTPEEIEARYANRNRAMGPLSWAVFSNDVEAVRYYLGRGHEVDERSRDGQNHTPLHWASLKGGDTGLEMVRVLLDAGADVNAQRSGGTTALMFAVRNHSLRTVQLLVERGADVRLRNSAGDNALDWAIQERDKVEQGTSPQLQKRAREIFEFLRKVDLIQLPATQATAARGPFYR